MENEILNSMMNTGELEEGCVRPDQITKFLASIVTINTAVGKLDVLAAYMEKQYHNDQFSLSVIKNVIDQLVTLTGTQTLYREMEKIEVKAPVKQQEKPQVQQPKPEPKIEEKIVPAIQEVSKKVVEKAQEIVKSAKTKAPKALPPVSLIEGEVNSTNLKFYSYNPSTKDLEILFQNGRLYRYSNVPKKTVHDCFKKAQRPGSYFNNNIKNTFKFKEITSVK